jgi:L-alanine-DL-glutamate epimerase-like enolase superfamily enzyme
LPKNDIRRIRTIGDALGNNVELMCDITQRWSVEQAIGLGPSLEEFNLTWLEDPTPQDDLAGRRGPCPNCVWRSRS